MKRLLFNVMLIAGWLACAPPLSRADAATSLTDSNDTLSTSAKATHLGHPRKANATDPSRAQPLRSFTSSSAFDPQRLVAKTVMASSVFAASCLVILWAARHYQAKRERSGASQSKLSVLESLPIAPRCTLQLVRVEDQKFLVARDGTGLRSITPVNSFANMLDDAAPLGDPVTDDRLGRSSQAGLSLESSDMAGWPSEATTHRREDPWTGTRPKL